jgi:hypothetical protein
MTARWRLLAGGLLVLACLCHSARAHEEKLVIGEVEAVNLQRNLLVVHELQTGMTVRLTVDANTEVILCQRGVPASEVQVGRTVRVKYLDRATGGQEALSILILHSRGGRPGAKGAD